MMSESKYKPGDWVIRTNIRTADDHAPGIKATLLERTQLGVSGLAGQTGIDVWLVVREDGQQEEWSTNTFHKAWGSADFSEGMRVRHDTLGEGPLERINREAGTGIVNGVVIALDRLFKVERGGEEDLALAKVVQRIHDTAKNGGGCSLSTSEAQLLAGHLQRLHEDTFDRIMTAASPLEQES